MNKILQNKGKSNKYYKILPALVVAMIMITPFNSVSFAATENNLTIMTQAQIDELKVTIDLNNKTLEEILRSIGTQTKLEYIFHSSIKMDNNEKFSLKVKDVSVKEALTSLLKGSKYGYRIENGRILIVKATPPPTKTDTSKKVTVTGKVVNADQQPVIGATIMVEGTTDGAFTQDKGTFSIQMQLGKTLEISCLGYNTVKKVVNTATENLIFTLEDAVMSIDQVVVTGMFERKANTFTGAVTTIKQDEMKRVGNSNLMQALKNIDPSIMFFDNMEFGSDPNKMPEMVMRGKSSLNIGDTDLRSSYQNDPNSPLFVLDGFEVSLQKVMDLDMNRVETMTILKDASAKAIYGSKAANGVIVIELKKNGDGKLRVRYDASVEIQAPDLTSYNLTNAAEKLDVEKQHGLFDDPNGYAGNTQLALNQLYNQKRTFVASGIDTDWMSKPLQLGVGTKHSVSVELGDGALKSIVDLSYNKVEGVMKGSDRTNISGGVTLNYRHKKFLFRNQLTITSNVSNDSKYGNFSEYVKINPYYTPYDQNGNLLHNIVPSLTDLPNDVTVADWYGKLEFQANPLYNSTMNTVLQNRYIDITNNFDLQYFVTNELKLTARFGLTEKRDKGDNFYPSDHLKFVNFTGENELRKGSYTLSHGQQSDLSGRFDIQYNKEILPKNMVYFNGGFDISQKSSMSNIVSAEGFPSEMMTDIMFARQYTKDTKPTGTENTVRDIGYYMSLNYSYDDRINVDGTFRQNASSMYGANSRWGAFWSAGMAWNIHNEKWMNSDVISRLRVRASVGSTGSQSSSAYNAIATYNYFLDRTYEGLIGAQLMSMRNDDLKWQQKNDTNFGFEMNVKRNLSFRFDYYISMTNNALNPLTLAPSTGFSSVQENAGKIQNRGFDARVSWTVWNRPKDRAFLTFTAAVSRNKNKLIEISDALKTYNEQQNRLANSGIDENGQRTGKPLQKYYNGMSMDAIWAMRSLGIDPANGDELYLRKDANGNYFRSYIYDANSQVVCGDALPKIHGNFGFNFEYKGFALNATCTFKYGGQMYNTTLLNKVENANLSENVDRRIFTDRWRNPGDQKPYKKLQKVTYTNSNNMNASAQTLQTSRFVQDRNEITISSLQLSYDFYRFKFVKKMGLERFRLAFNMNDLLTISTIEIERGTSYPFARTFNGSLSITF